MAAPRLVVEFDASLVKKGAVEVKKAFADMGISAEAFERSVERASSKNKRMENSLRAIENRLDPVARATARYERTVKQLEEGLRRNIIDQAKYNRLLGLAKSEFEQSGNAASRASGQILKYAASFLSIQAGVRVIRQLAEAQMELERVQARLRIASGGDSALAANTYKELATEAKRLGLDLNSLAGSYSKLAVASRGTALEGRAAWEVFMGISEASAAVGLSSEQTEGALRAVEQMISKGTVQAEELRGQLGERLPGAFEMSARAMGVTTMELGKMLQRGEVLASDLLPKLAQELRKTYGEEAIANADRLTGATNNLSTAWTELKNAINASGMGESFVAVLKMVTEGISGITEVIAFLDKALKDFGQGSLLEVINRFTVLTSVTKAYQKIKGSVSNELAAPSGAVTVSPLERYRAPEASKGGLTDEAMMAALKASVKGLDDAATAGKKYSDSLKEIAKLEKSIAEHRAAIDFAKWELSFLPANENFQADINALQTMEVKVDALDTTTRSLMDAAFNTNEAFAKLGEQHGVEELEATIKEINAEWEEFEKQVSENFLRGVQSSLSSFFYEVMDGGEDALKNFGKSLKELLFKTLAEYLAQWAITQMKMLALSLKRIAAEKAAQKAAGVAENGDKSTSSTGWLATIAKLFKGGGGGSTMAAAGGIIIAAAAVAAILYKRNKDAQREFDQRRDTTASLNFAGNGAYGSASGRMAPGTGQNVADAMANLFNSLNSVTRAGITAMDAASIDIANGGKYFDAKINGAIVGRFTSVEEAIIAAVGGAFARTGAKIDGVVMSAINAFSGKSVEDLTTAVTKMQEVADAFNGESGLMGAISAVASSSRALKQELIDLGVNGFDAAVTASRSMVVGYREAWNQLSGAQLSPKERMAQAEASRALLLAEMKMEREKLAVDIKILQGKAKLNANLIRLDQAYLQGETLVVRMKGKLWGDELSMSQQYLEGRQKFVEAEAGLFDAQLEAMGVVLQELDKLIATVSVGKISLGGGGKGKGGVEDVIPKATGSGGGWHQRLLSAVETIRDAQKRLVFGELSPFTGREKVTAAQSEVERLRAQYAMGGRNKILAMEELPEAVERYLELFKGTYGSSGAYEDIARAMNDMYSSILTQHGVAPVTVMQEQARANADAMGRIFSRDNRGKLHTRNEELERELVVMKRDGDETKRNTSIMVESLSRIEQNTRNSGMTGSVTAPPRALLERAG